MLRKPGAKEDFVRGRSGQFPFAPGGLEVLSADASVTPVLRIDKETRIGPLSSIPPGFTRGLKLKDTNDEIDIENTEIEDVEDDAEVIRNVHITNPVTSHKEGTQSGFEAIDDLLPDELSLLTSRGSGPSRDRNKGKEWAHVVDVNQEMTNFHELVPEMAHQVRLFS
jgi:antiviral helicase SKI2